MATPAGQFRPGRLVATFAMIVVVLYGLLFFTPGSNSPKLGIDLQGGTRITLTAQTLDGSTPSQDEMNQARTIMENRVNGSGVAGAQVQIEGSNQLTVTVPGTQPLSDLTRSAIMNIRAVLGSGVDATLLPTSTSTSTSGAAPTTAPAIGDTQSAKTTPVAPKASGLTSGAAKTSAAKTSAAAKTTMSPQGLRRAAAATSPVATPTSAAAATTPAAAATPEVTATPIEATVPATPAAAAAKAWPLAGSDPKNPNQPAGTDATAWTTWETAAQTAMTNSTITCAEIDKTAGLDDASKPLLACGNNTLTTADYSSPCNNSTTACMYVLDKTLIPGKQISDAGASTDTSGGWDINLTFNSSGFSTWETFTAANVGKQTAFTLDGEVLSAPSINSAIDTPVTQVTGNFTQATATSLADSLKFGALPLHFAQQDSESVSAQLGLQYLQAGLIAGGIGLLLVVIYCLIYYRLLGLITILSLVLSGSLVYVIMVLLGRWISLSLDMAGVAGLIVAIGITADSFVIYFERLKDEVREGRTFRSAVPRGWERAKRTILSADAVSFLSALVLYLIAVGDVKGFAFTLGLSTILDLVVVFLVTHPLVAWASGSKMFQSARFSGLGAVAKAGAQQRAAAARLTAKEV